MLLVRKLIESHNILVIEDQAVAIRNERSIDSRWGVWIDGKHQSSCPTTATGCDLTKVWQKTQ